MEHDILIFYINILYILIFYSETSFNVVRQPSTASSQIYIDRERNER